MTAGNTELRQSNMITIYNTHLNHIRQNESNVLKFIATLFTAIGGWNYIYICEGCHIIDSWLWVASIGATIILYWGVLYIISMSFTHRYLQLIMWHYETSFGIIYPVNWNPENKFGRWNGCDMFRWDLVTSPYKAHLFTFYCGIVYIWSITISIPFINCCKLPTGSNIVCAVLGILAIIIIVLLVNWLIISWVCCHYLRKLKGLIGMEKA